jgi:hypothetical protein
LEKRSEYVNIGVIVKTPKSNLDSFFESLSSLDQIKVVYKYVSWLPLWIVEKDAEAKTENGATT